MTETQGDTREPTRMATIKQQYDDCQIGYDTALAMLEALGMWEDDADNYLAQKP